MKAAPIIDGDIMKLIPKRKKGILRLLFSRFGIMVVLLLVQLLFVLAAIQYFEEYSMLFSVFRGLLTVSLVFFLFNCGMDYSAKLTWLIVIMLFPLPGSFFLWFTQRSIGNRRLMSNVRNSVSTSMGMIEQKVSVMTDPDIVSSGTDDLSRYLNLTGCYPLYENTDVKFFPLGEYKFKALVEDLKKAEKFIFMEYFIIDEGLMWGTMLKILAEKAASGVDVRVLYDGMCEISTLTLDYSQRLCKLGIKCKPFSPIRPFLSTHYNYRDHRKILVIDGKVAYNGGVNLGDEYINHIERFGHWKDTAVRLQGEAVQSFTLMFLTMWNLNEALVG